MTPINYDYIVNSKPTEILEIKNQRHQQLSFVEDPINPDRPVIVICHELKEAASTDFFDTSDFFKGSDYLPVFKYGKFLSAWEVDL